MDWGWATSLDQLWRSPTFPMWLTLAAAGFFGLIVLITLLRAEKSVANGALTVITLLAIGIAVAATIRGFGPEAGPSSANRPLLADAVSVPALACIDDLAGDTVLAACEKVLFGSAESSAAAVSYAATRITRLTSFGDVQAASSNMTPELQALRRAVEHDRYGLMAYVLSARDHCTPSICTAFRSLTEHNQIVANMEERTYEGLVSRYALSWGAPAASGGAVAALQPSMPTGKPTNADFPSAASTPAVSIMTAEPAASSPPPRAAANAPSPAAHPTPAPRKPAPKPHAAAPVQIAPPAPAPSPAAGND